MIEKDRSRVCREDGKTVQALALMEGRRSKKGVTGK